jgi:uncharacterized cupin superfamily protein
MSDVTVKHIDELESYDKVQKYRGQFRYAGKGLGISAWGMNVLVLPPGWAEYPEHDHERDGQKEVYVVLKGSATLQTEGKTWQLGLGTLARVGPTQKRKIIPGKDGVIILALGGTPGKAYEPPRRW